MAVEGLNRVIKEKGENIIHMFCTKFNIPKLKPGEILFLKEYGNVMKFVAQALNILQGESNHAAIMVKWVIWHQLYAF